MSDCPLVLCLTNTVAANFTANCLLSIGAKPAMIEEPAEAAELASVADAMLVNLGTVTELQAETMRAAIVVANRRGMPWVLDPVAIQALTYRRELAGEFISMKPTLIRGNHDETDFVTASRIVTLSTGEEDEIYAADISVAERIVGGVPMLQTVTATGCAQGALAAAALGRGMSPIEAARWASRLMKKAGELAYGRAKAPGSFMVALVDALWELTHE